MRLARDTHLAALSERDERTAGAHPDCGPCVRDSLRTVAHARVIHQGRLFARRTATRMSMDDARPGRAVNELGVTRVTRRSQFQRSAALMGLKLPFAGLIPHVQGSGRFRSLQTLVRVGHDHSFPDHFRRATAGARLRLTDATVAGWGGCALKDPAYAPDVWSDAGGLKICSTPAAILPWALRMSGTVRGREM
jgi:hypothetical protein